MFCQFLYANIFNYKNLWKFYFIKVVGEDKMYILYEKLILSC